MFPLFKMNSLTMVDSSFWSRVASLISPLVACGSRERSIGLSYLARTEYRTEGISYTVDGIR